MGLSPEQLAKLRRHMDGSIEEMLDVLVSEIERLNVIEALDLPEATVVQRGQSVDLVLLAILDRARQVVEDLGTAA